ncbi:MAG: RluA family pseudouridine synthase [Paludibacteraceae bacterium]|nr:RluA family pseudouridine synthase [Paludibacteraceae bacterium]MBO7317035.1 RluA family pseudouridine synthase [Paludibacteraceae bacterium]
MEELDFLDEKFIHHRLQVDKGQTSIRIDKFLVDHLSDISRNRIQEAANSGFVLVNGVAVKSNYRIKPYDDIAIILDHPKTDFDVVPREIPLNVVYEDDDILLINKQPNLVVHPGVGNRDNTLLHALAWHWKDEDSLDVNYTKMGLVHRIDKDTSGLLIIAKNSDAKTKLGLQFFNKTTERTYNALVWGVLKEDEGTITGAIARDQRIRMSFAIYDENENPNAKHAVTHYKVLERFAYATLVQCKLETGRTHQIRVHMKHIGHTLFNDERYGGDEILKGVRTAKYKQFVQNCFDLCPRQALHAKTLGFEHPTTGKWMQFTSDLPDDMQALIEKWRRYSPKE